MPCPFGDKIRELREKSGLTKSALAKAAGMGRGAYTRLERGLHPPDVEVLAKLAAALKMRPDDLRSPGWAPVPVIRGRRR